MHVLLTRYRGWPAAGRIVRNRPGAGGRHTGHIRFLVEAAVVPAAMGRASGRCSEAVMLSQAVSAQHTAAYIKPTVTSKPNLTTYGPHLHAKPSTAGFPTPLESPSSCTPEQRHDPQPAQLRGPCVHPQLAAPLQNDAQLGVGVSDAHVPALRGGMLMPSV